MTSFLPKGEELLRQVRQAVFLYCGRPVGCNVFFEGGIEKVYGQYHMTIIIRIAIMQYLNQGKSISLEKFIEKIFGTPTLVRG